MSNRVRNATVSQLRRKRERDNRASSILRAAEKVFFTKGYNRATMEDIAQVAEITKPTIYSYFPTKDDLFLSLMLPVIDDIQEQLLLVQERLEGGGFSTGGELIRGIVRALAHSYALAPEACKIVQLVQQTKVFNEFGEVTRRTLDERSRRNFDIFRRILGNGITRRLLKPIGIHELADVIWGTVVGVILLEDIKLARRNRAEKERLERTLKVAEDILACAIEAA